MGDGEDGEAVKFSCFVILSEAKNLHNTHFNGTSEKRTSYRFFTSFRMTNVKKGSFQRILKVALPLVFTSKKHFLLPRPVSACDAQQHPAGRKTGQFQLDLFATGRIPAPEQPPIHVEGFDIFPG